MESPVQAKCQYGRKIRHAMGRREWVKISNEARGHRQEKAAIVHVIMP